LCSLFYVTHLSRLTVVAKQEMTPLVLRILCVVVLRTVRSLSLQTTIQYTVGRERIKLSSVPYQETALSLDERPIGGHSVSSA